MLFSGSIGEHIMAQEPADPVTRDKELDGYLGKIRRIPLLDQEEERRLGEAWTAGGDEKALNRLVTSHLRLVAKIARRYRGYGLPIADLIGHGNLGLMRAAKGFRPEKGVRFATYAGWWIRAEMQEYVLSAWSLVRIARNHSQKKLFFNLRRLKATLGIRDEGDLPEPAVSRIAGDLSVPTKAVIHMNRRLAGKELSLNCPLSEDSEEEWQDVLADERPDPEASVGNTEELRYRAGLFRSAINVLDDREREILMERHLREEPVTLDRLSARYRVSRERVRQIEAQAVAKLRSRMRPPGGKPTGNRAPCKSASPAA
jgi:RNA polymerase sigma-32 factor